MSLRSLSLKPVMMIEKRKLRNGSTLFLQPTRYADK